MSIRTKVMLLVSFLCLFSILLIYLVVSRVLVKSYEEIELADASRHLLRIKSSFEQLSDRIGVINKDWATWDDTYDFILNRNPEYTKSNLLLETFQDLNINLFIYLNTDGEIVYSSLYDAAAGETIKIPPELDIYIQNFNKNFYLNKKPLDKEGTLDTSGGLLVFSQKQILNSEGTKPHRGFLIMGKFLNAQDVSSMRALTRDDLKIVAFSNLAPEQRALFARYLSDKETYIQTTQKAHNLYVRVNDASGSPAALITSTLTRDIAIQGNKTLQYLFIATLIVGVFSLLVGNLFMERVILKPLRDLVEAVDEISTRKDFKSRVEVCKEQEFCDLSENINLMLDRLEKSEKGMLETNVSLQKKATELEEKTRELEKINQYMVGREIRMAELKDELNELKVRFQEKQKSV